MQLLHAAADWGSASVIKVLRAKLHGIRVTSAGELTAAGWLRQVIGGDLFYPIAHSVDTLMFETTCTSCTTCTTSTAAQ